MCLSCAFSYGPFGPIDDCVALWLYLGVMVLVYFHYTIGVIHDICNYLGIYCLRLHPSTRKTN